MCWWLVGRLGVSRLRDRFWLALLFGFSTQILWITTRGGVWHTGQLIATLLTLRLPPRAVGQAAGVAHRAAGGRRVPDPGAAGVRGAVLRPAARARPGRSADRLGPRLLSTAARAGSRGARGACWRSASCRRSSSSSPTTRSASGRRSSRATRWRRCRRSSRSSARSGLFSLAHVPMNLDYLFFHLPKLIPDSAVLQARRPRAVGLPDQPRAALRGPGRLAADQLVAAAGGRGRRPDPVAALLRRWLAPVRLPLLRSIRSRSSSPCARARRRPAGRSGWAGGS